MPKRIVFTGDILQVNPDGSPTKWRETPWLADLLRYQVSLACPDMRIEVVSWDNPVSSFDGARFYALNGMNPCIENWALLEGAEKVSTAAAEYLLSFFQDAVVIGNTISTLALRIFNTLGIPYVDFTVHPARFLDDLFFAVRTNSAPMFSVLQENHYPEEAIRLQAAIHRSSLRRPDPADIVPDSGLFAAQHGTHMALVSDGRVCEIEDYREGIQEFLSRHKYVYVKPHPYVPKSARIVAFLRALAGDSGRIRIINDNVYSVLSHSNISEVCGISSSVVHEAEYFGKAATFLSNNCMQFCGPQDELDPYKFVPVYEAYYNPGFWRRLLAGVCPVSTCPDIELPRKTSRIRNALQMYWGYSYLDWEIPLRTLGIHPPPPPSPPSAQASYEEGLRLYQLGSYPEAVECFATALVERETAERWNDWAVAELRAGQSLAARDGFRMATALEPGNRDATVNLQALLTRDTLMETANESR